jgi:hypothetical protein
MWFPFLGLEDLHNNDVQTTNVEDMTKKLCMVQDKEVACKMFKPFLHLFQKGLHRRGCPRWPKISNLNPSVGIDKLTALVGTKMYTFARFDLCYIS